MIGSSKAEGMVLGLEVEFRWIGLRETLQEPPTNLMITTMFPCSFFPVNQSIKSTMWEKPGNRIELLR